MVGDADHGTLAESRFVERPFLPGGEHNMYELAFAAAAAGRRVELRGWLDRPAFNRFRSVLRVAPEVELSARLPQADDLVIVPEGWRDPLGYAQLLLSPARLAIFILAAPGLFGWPFGAESWSPPDPLTVDIETLATPAQFQAMDSLGLALLTHSPGIADAAAAAGVSCMFVGTGRPYDLPPPAESERTVDAVGLLANRWAPLVRQVAEQMDELAVDLVPEVPNAEIVARLAKARTLIWPSRVEGHATIPWEARSVGCVPVALSSNRFAVGLDEASGAVIVDTVDEIAPAVRALLEDRGRWRELSGRGIERARAETDWTTYVKRVSGFLDSVAREPMPPAHEALAAIGAVLRERNTVRAAEGQERLEEAVAEQERLREDRARIVEEREGLAAALHALYDRRAVRALLRLDSVREQRHRRHSD
jgi:hypothetical protein